MLLQWLPWWTTAWTCPIRSEGRRADHPRPEPARRCPLRGAGGGDGGGRCRILRSTFRLACGRTTPTRSSGHATSMARRYRSGTSIAMAIGPPNKPRLLKMSDMSELEHDLRATTEDIAADSARITEIETEKGRLSRGRPEAPRAERRDRATRPADRPQGGCRKRSGRPACRQRGVRKLTPPDRQASSKTGAAPIR